MTDNMYIKRISTIVEDGAKANATGYSAVIGYTTTVGSTQIQRTESQAVLETAYIKENTSFNNLSTNKMTDDLQMLHLAAIIENGSKASANGYTKPVGYTNPVGYSAPIGSMDTIIESEAALEAGLINSMPTPKTTTPEDKDVEVQAKVPASRTELKKSLLDRIKEKPMVYTVIVAVLALVGYGVYKSKKG